MLLAVAVVAEAQQPKKVPRIGFLSAASPSAISDRLDSFRQGLTELGYIEGKNIAVEYRYADGKTDRLPALAVELVAAKLDLIVAATTPGVLAVKKASATVPVVFVDISDPVANGLVVSLSRPGGNITGLTILGPELSGKRLELLKEAAPNVAVWRSYGTPLILLMNSCGKRPRRWHTNYVSSSNLWKCGVATILTLHSKPP